MYFLGEGIVHLSLLGWKNDQVATSWQMPKTVEMRIDDYNARMDLTFLDSVFIRNAFIINWFGMTSRGGVTMTTKYTVKTNPSFTETSHGVRKSYHRERNCIRIFRYVKKPRKKALWSEISWAGKSVHIVYLPKYESTSLRSGLTLNDRFRWLFLPQYNGK